MTKEEGVVNAKNSASNFVKSRMFDVIAIGIVVSMLALTLGILELREINFRELVNILIETLPFYLCNLLLTTNYYNKGTFTGKKSKSFVSVVTDYSKHVGELTGEQVSKLPDFCNYYNEKVILNKQTIILKSVALNYDQFNNDYTENGVSHGPLRALCKHDLVHLLGEERACAVIDAKNVKIKGLRTNSLLGNSDYDDPTNIGLNEKGLRRSRTITYAVTGFASIFLLTMIAVKNVLDWGWVGLVFTGFKLLYIVCRSYMHYFDGYQDIVTNLANHISRKTDVLKEYVAWFNTNFVENIAEKGNISEK